MARLLITKAELTGSCTDNLDRGIKWTGRGESRSCPGLVLLPTHQAPIAGLDDDYTVDDKLWRVFEASAGSS
jgi:hypothetical protein